MKLRVHTALERAFMRVSFALVLFDLLPSSLRYHQQPAPNGIAHYFDLTVFADPARYTLLVDVAFVCLLGYAAGFSLRLATTFLTALVIVIGTLSNSQGAIDHGYNAIALVLLGHCLGYWCFPLWRRVQVSTPQASPDDLAINFSMQMLAAVYAIAAITKLRLTDGTWIANTPYLAVDILKANSQAHYNFGRPEQLAFGQRAAEFIVEHPLLWQVVFGSGLVLELAAVLALRSRTWAVLIGAGMYLLHESVTLLMSLSFHYNKQALLIFFVGLPLFAAQAVEWAGRRWPLPKLGGARG